MSAFSDTAQPLAAPDAALPATAEAVDGSTHRFACHEVWGGNRSIQSPVELPGIRGYIYSQPVVGARGGDVHYLSVCGSGLMSRVCLADVVGHGEAVAEISSLMHQKLRRSMNRTDQRSMLSDLNATLYEQGIDAMTTAAACTYLPPTRRLSVSYAGHEPAWYYSVAQQKWDRLSIEHPRKGLFDIALAVEKGVRYSRRKVRVRTGDRIVFFTDGLLETKNPQDEQFGSARLKAALEASTKKSCKQLAANVIEAVQSFAANPETIDDDMTIIALEFVDNLQSSAFWHLIRHRLFSREGIIYNEDAK